MYLLKSGDTASDASVAKTTKLNNKPGIGRFGSFTAQLSDGMTFAVSTYGPDGEPADSKCKTVEYRITVSHNYRL